MKKIIIIALVLMLTSCGSKYNFSNYKIKSILTITEAGDTLAVPVRDFKFRVLDRRIQELINRDPFRYQYRQDWRWNYNRYSGDLLNFPGVVRYYFLRWFHLLVRPDLDGDLRLLGSQNFLYRFLLHFSN